MISNQIILSTIREVSDISGIDFTVLDNFGHISAKTDNAEVPEKKLVLDFINSEAASEETDNFVFFKIYDENESSYTLVAKRSEQTHLVGKILSLELSNLVKAYKDKVDKNSFYQNLLLDNLLLVDIYNRAKKLHIEAVTKRCIYVIEQKSSDDKSGLEMVKALFNNETDDYVTTVDEDHIIVIKTLEDDSQETLNETALMLVDMFNSEAMQNVRVSFGTVISDIKGISKSYKEAIMALDVAKIFYEGKNIISYSTLGIGRLIYQLPANLCQMYIDEVFGGDLSSEIDEDILNTVNKFLDNSLNVSETSRQLYIHRNTLVYRIEKLQKVTGLDVRDFDDALTFRIAMMVLSYIKYMNNSMDK